MSKQIKERERMKEREGVGEREATIFLATKLQWILNLFPEIYFLYYFWKRRNNFPTRNWIQCRLCARKMIHLHFELILKCWCLSNFFHSLYKLNFTLFKQIPFYFGVTSNAIRPMQKVSLLCNSTAFPSDTPWVN